MSSTAPAVQAASDSMSEPEYPLELSVAAARDLHRTQPGRIVLLDVREPFELAICRLPDARAIPMREIPDHVGDLPRDQHLLVLCHHGSRSLRVTEYLRDQGFAAVTNIAGGIDAWAQEIDPSLARY